MEWYRDRFAGKTMLVTGASSGIGRSTVERLLAEGATVVGADIGEAPTVGAETGRFIFVNTDVRDEEAVVEAVSAAVEVGGRLDGLVHSAGVQGSGPVHLLENAEWDRVMATNLTGTFVVTKAALAQMVPQDLVDGERGAIVTVASVAGLQAFGATASYNAAKAGVVLLTRTLAVDYGPAGIRANVMCPGVIATPMSAAAFDGPGLAELSDSYRSAHALRRFGEPEEVAATAAFLLSRDASFISGAAIPVDGGYSAGSDHGSSDLLDLGNPVDG
jgi:NAD(P)-dependent dehydrogenase (short-subunit alcohol dehydrogenase family)